MTDHNSEEQHSIEKTDKSAEPQAEVVPIPQEVAEALEGVPPEARAVISGAFVSMNMQGNAPSSLTRIEKQINSGHIDKILDNSEKENEREFKKSSAAEVTKRSAMGVLVLLVVIILVYAAITKDKDLSEKVMNTGIGALGGFGAAQLFRKEKD